MRTQVGGEGGVSKMRADACVGEGGVEPVRAHSLKEAERLKSFRVSLGWVKHPFQLTQNPPVISKFHLLTPNLCLLLHPSLLHLAFKKL